MRPFTFLIRALSPVRRKLLIVAPLFIKVSLAEGSHGVVVAEQAAAITVAKDATVATLDSKVNGVKVTLTDAVFPSLSPETEILETETALSVVVDAVLRMLAMLQLKQSLRM